MRASRLTAGPRSRAVRLIESPAAAGILFSTPATVVIAGVLMFPIAYAAWITFVFFDPALGSGPFAGLSNYAEAFADPAVHTALWRTSEFAIPGVIGTAAIGLGMALVLQQPFPGRAAVRSLIVVPWGLGSIVTGLIWGWIFNSSFGTLNGLLGVVGLIHEPVPWLGSGTTAPFVLALVFSWATSPIAALLFSSALQAIPPELERAAEADGASALARLLYITIPLLRPTILVVMIIVTVDAFTAFGLIFVLTAGGPGSATTTLAWLGYITVFRYFNFSEGTAIFVLLSALIVILGLAYNRLFQTGGVAGRDA